MNNTFINPVVAIVIGTGVGMLLSVFCQKGLNAMYQAECLSKPNHQLVMIDSFIGDAYYCIDKRYL